MRPRFAHLSPRVLIALACAVILLLFVAALGLVRLSATPSVTASWRGSATGFSSQDQQGITQQLKTIFASVPQSGVHSQDFAVISAQRDGAQAVLSIAEYDNGSAQPLAGEPLFAIARFQNGVWTVWTPGSDGFCDQLRQLPGDLFAPDDQRFFDCS